MTKYKHSIAFWIIVFFLVLTMLLTIIGPSMGVFNYNLTVRLGLQDSPKQVGEFGVQVNRAFGASDTIIYLPLMLISLIGLFLKKRWSLVATAAVGAITAYTASTLGFMYLFLPGTPGYNLTPGFEIWFFVGAAAIFGIWIILFIIHKGDKLLD